MDRIKIKTPISDDVVLMLRVGERILLSGDIYTARDAAHIRMAKMVEDGLPLPFDPIDKVLYYAGPCPAPPGKIIGSVGPTTSSRMDAYTPILMERGLKVMIGKGPRNQTVMEALVKYSGVYFSAIGGTGALIAQCVKEVQVYAFEDLGTEAIYKLKVEDMPLIVAADSTGADIYNKITRLTTL